MKKAYTDAFYSFRVAIGTCAAEVRKAIDTFIESANGKLAYNKASYNAAEKAYKELKDVTKTAFDAAKKDGDKWTGSDTQKALASFWVAIRKRYSDNGVKVAKPKANGNSKGGNGKTAETTPETVSEGATLKTTKGAILPMLAYLEALKGSGMTPADVKKAFNGSFVEVFGVSPYNVG